MTKHYKIHAPLGNVTVPKEALCESELRAYAKQITPVTAWQEKFDKDPIADVIALLRQGGYVIEELWAD